jgi:branched-chain amino acid transport system substrate-binding protein
MTRRPGIVAVVAIVGAGFFACAKSGHNRNILLGEYGSLTGDTATFGQSTDQGIHMALAEINAAGGVLGKPVKIIVEDDQSKPEEAASAVTKLITQDNVVAVLGEVASNRSLAAAPICQSDGIPMVTPSSTNPRVTQVGDDIFRVCFIDPFQGAVGAKIARDLVHAKKVAVLYDVGNDYSIGLRTFFSQRFREWGGEIVGEQSYREGDSDFHAQLTQLKATNPDAIYVPGYYTEVGTIARQARDLGIAVPLIGGDGWDSPKLFEIGGAALNGCYISDHYSPDDPDPNVRKFVRLYSGEFHHTPDALAALSYDATRILCDAIRRAGSTDGDKIRDALAATKNFPGVTGKITIDKNRNAVTPAVVLKIEDGKLHFVERIPPEDVK